MVKRKADTGKDVIRRCSRRLQDAKENAKEKERKRVEEVKITKLSADLTPGEFNALYSTKKSITIACPPEDRLPKFHPGLYIELYSMVRYFIHSLAISSSMVEELTFENVPVTALHLYKLVKYCCLPTLKSITIKRNMCRGQFSLSDTLSIRLGPDAIATEEHLSNKYTYELPSESVLETISFEQGVKKANNKDLQALNYFVEMNRHIKSIKVLNSDKHVKQLSTDSSKKVFMQATLNIISKRFWNKYHAKLAQLDSVKDKDRSKYMKLKALLWSHTVAKLLSDPSSIPGIFDKDDRSMLYGSFNSGGIDDVTNGYEESRKE